MKERGDQLSTKKKEGVEAEGSGVGVAAGGSKAAGDVERGGGTVGGARGSGLGPGGPDGMDHDVADVQHGYSGSSNWGDNL